MVAAERDKGDKKVVQELEKIYFFSYQHILLQTKKKKKKSPLAFEQPRFSLLSK